MAHVGEITGDRYQSSRLPGAAKRATMAGMRWHPEPTDEIWKQALLAMVEGMGKRLWLSCDQCQHWVMIEVRGFAEQHGLDMRTPLLMISGALKCSHGERRSWCRPEPHGYGMRR